MIRESVTILIIGLLLLAMFLRSRHYGYALAVAPVFFIPIVHLISRALFFFFKTSFFGIRFEVATAFADLLGLLASGVAIAFISQKIESKRNKALYLVMMLIYTVVLGWVYIYNALHGLFV